MNHPNLAVAVLRFIRVVGGQTLGYAITAAGTYVASADFGPESVLIATVIGAVLTSADKYFRSTGLYGTPDTTP